MKRRTWIITVAVVIVALIVGGGWFFFFRDTSPQKVTLEDALKKAGAATTASTGAGASSSSASASTAPTTTGATGATTTGATGATSATVATTAATGTTNAGPLSALDGTWSLKSGMENFVGFRIQEELAGFGSKTVVGRTPAVTGSMALKGGTTISGVKIDADMTQITTDSSQRNRAIKTRGLETNSFPTASFEQTAPVTLPAPPADGAALSATIKGNLTVHGVTKPMDIPVKAQLAGDTVVVVVEPVQVAIADFAIEKPLVPGQVLSIEDTAQFELQLFFVKSAP